MKAPTKLYVVVVLTAGGEWLKFHDTDNLEFAVNQAATELRRCQLRNWHANIYAQAIGVDIMKRNSSGDYDGLASFIRS